MRGDHRAVEGTFVGETLLGKALVEVVIDVDEVAPQTQEALFELRLVLFSEVAEKVLQQLALLIGKVAEVVELMDVAQVGKDTVGIGHILVDVVEIADQ